MSQSDDFLNQLVNRGKRLLLLILIINIVLMIVFSGVSISLHIFSFSNLIDVLISILICIFIYMGSRIAKWIYIIFTAISTLNIFILLNSFIQYDGINFTAQVWIIILLPLLTKLASAALLIFSESINEFLYSQAN